MYVQSGPEAAGAESEPRSASHSLDEAVANVLTVDLSSEDAEARILKELSSISKYMCGKITFALNCVQLRELFQGLKITEKPQLAPLIIACRAQEHLDEACVQEVAELHSLELRSVCRAILKLRDAFADQIDVSDLEINSEARVLCEVAQSSRQFLQYLRKFHASMLTAITNMCVLFRGPIGTFELIRTKFVLKLL